MGHEEWDSGCATRLSCCNGDGGWVMSDELQVRYAHILFYAGKAGERA